MITLKDQRVISNLVPVKYFTFYTNFNYVFMCITEYGFVHLSVCQLRPDGGVVSGTVVLGVCQLSNVDTNCEELAVRS